MRMAERRHVQHSHASHVILAEDDYFVRRISLVQAAALCGGRNVPTVAFPCVILERLAGICVLGCVCSARHESSKQSILCSTGGRR